MEGWFPRSCGEHTRQRIAMRGCLRSESSDRAARKRSAAARAEPRVRSLNSRPPSQNGSRRPDRSIGGDGESSSCAPTLWKEFLAAFFGSCPITRRYGKQGWGDQAPPWARSNDTLPRERRAGPREWFGEFSRRRAGFRLTSCRLPCEAHPARLQTYWAACGCTPATRSTRS